MRGVLIVEHDGDNNAHITVLGGLLVTVLVRIGSTNVIKGVLSDILIAFGTECRPLIYAAGRHNIS